MRKTFVTCFALFCALSSLSQTATFQFLDDQSEKGMPDVNVYNHNQRVLVVSNENDLSIYYDGIPINISNHAHGQGYSDMHFIILEIIYGAGFYKDPHELRNGNFVVSEAARFKTKSSIDQNLVKLDVGDFGTQCGVIILNLTPKNNLFSKKNSESAYLAVEGNLNQSFSDSPQEFKKLSTLFRYFIQLKKTTLSRGTSYLTSSWNSSGQIPLGVVNNGSIDWYVVIYDTEGGNAFIKTKTRLKGSQAYENFLYHRKNDYKLDSNFTFFLNDSINGDMIDQREGRHMVGYRVKYKRFDKLKNILLKSEVGNGIKDEIAKTGLHKSYERATLGILDRHDVLETNTDVHIRKSIELNSRWTIIARTIIYSPIEQLSIYVGGRYVMRCPLIEDESVWADDYLMSDVNATCTFKNDIQLVLSIQNSLNEQWMEAVCYYTSRLENETEVLNDFYFTPGIPRSIKESISYSF